MSEHDRGAYTPPTDEPLAFDARPAVRTRRPVPMTLVASTVVLVVLVCGVVVFYRSGVRGANEPPRAVGTTVAQIKTAPTAEEAKPVDQAAGLDVYVDDKGGEAVSGQPKFAPEPEQPQARPAPVQVAQAPAAPVQLPPAPAQPQPAPVQVATAQPSTAQAGLRPATTASRPAAPAPAPAKTVPVAPPAAKSVQLAQAEKPAPTTPAPASAGGALVQIGAFNSTAIADQEFAKVRASFGKYVAGKGKRVEPVERGGQTLYRTAFTGFTKAEAQAFCGALKAAGKACIVK
jgi:hypothetical protein